MQWAPILIVFLRGTEYPQELEVPSRSPLKIYFEANCAFQGFSGLVYYVVTSE